ncbi:MAG: ATP-binding protein [Anaerolineae bacterium]
MRTLAFKLSLAFLLVALTGILIVALLAGRTTTTQFDDFLDRQEERILFEALVTYYTNNGSWLGIQRVIRQRIPGGEDPRGRGGFWTRPMVDFVLADENGRVVVGSAGYEVDEQLTDAQLASGQPIVMEGERVGTIVSDSIIRQTENDAEFLAAVYRSIFVGAIGAAGVALVLAVVLARSLTRPLKEMTAATQAIAAGDLEQHVPVRSQDEIGRLAESFNRMNAELARSRDLRHQMTADIAHDLRTPLSVILGHTEGLADGVLPPNAETFHMLHDEARRLNRLIEDLRTLSLSEAGELPLLRRSVPTAAFLRRVAATHQAYAQQRDVTLHLEMPDDLPEVHIDPDRMKQVLDNLLSNALRYIQSGKNVTLGASRTARGVQIRVQDDGPGIAPTDLPYIFDRFYRGDKSRQRKHDGGSGLGLAIARSIVETHGGTIHAENRGGAVFTIDLPQTLPG